MALGWLGIAAIVLVFAALTAAIVLLVIWQMRVAAAKRAAYLAWCQERGFQFIERDGDLERAYRGFKPFGQGSQKICSDILQGRIRDHPVRIFGYQYTVQSGKSSHTVHHRILAIRMGEDGRGLSIQKEHLGHKLFDALGGEDIDFESDAFSRTFWVRCQDRRFAYDLLHPRMQEWLLEHGQRHWQWQGGTLLLHESGRMGLEHVDGLLGPAFAFIDLLPRHRMPAEASV